MYFLLRKAYINPDFFRLFELCISNGNLFPNFRSQGSENIQLNVQLITYFSTPLEVNGNH